VHIVVVETLGLLVVGVFEGIGEVVVRFTVLVVCTRSVVNGETGSLVGLPVGQSVVGSNVGQDVVASVGDTVVHGGQGAQVCFVVGVVNGVVHEGVVSLDVVDVGQGGQVANVDVIVVVVATGCGSSTARTTVSNRLSLSICVAWYKGNVLIRVSYRERISCICTLITMYRILSVGVPSTGVINSISMGTPLSGCGFFIFTSSSPN